MIKAVFFPADHLPENFSLMETAVRAQRDGCTLHTNGRQHALFAKTPKTGGWQRCVARVESQPCAA